MPKPGKTVKSSPSMFDCPVCHARHGSTLELALHIMRGKPSFVEHAKYVEQLAGMKYTAFIRELQYVKKLALLLENEHTTTEEE